MPNLIQYQLMWTRDQSNTKTRHCIIDNSYPLHPSWNKSNMSTCPGNSPEMTPRQVSWHAEFWSKSPFTTGRLLTRSVIVAARAGPVCAHARRWLHGLWLRRTAERIYSRIAFLSCCRVLVLTNIVCDNTVSPVQCMYIWYFIFVKLGLQCYVMLKL